MRRGRILIFLVLIVVIGLALLYFAYTQFGGAITPQPTAAALTEVYYAAQNIPQGTTIKQEMLGTFSIPPENVADVMFTRGEESALVGQAARFSLDQGVIITSSMVGTGPGEIAGPPWAVNIPSGMVAAAIPTSRLSLVGYGVNDGAHVNVNACMLFVDVDPAFQTMLPNFTSVLTGTGFQEGSLPILSVAASSGELPSRQGRVELDPTLQQPFYAVPSRGQRAYALSNDITGCDRVEVRKFYFASSFYRSKCNAFASSGSAAGESGHRNPDGKPARFDFTELLCL
jgi:hypothetical protein